MFNTCNLADAFKIYLTEAQNGFDVGLMDMYKLFVSIMLDEIKQGELSILFTEEDWNKIAKLQKIIRG